MGDPPTKISNARSATEAAIDALRDGVLFAVVEGTHEARMVYPTDVSLAEAGPETKAAARDRVRHLVSWGGTMMGAWLRRADELFDTRPAAIRHVLLLTDGRNESEQPGELGEVLEACEGRFVCDGRGIGDDYSPEELSRVVSALHGSADAIVDYSDLAGDFVAIMRAAMAKVVPDVRLRVRQMPFATVRFVRQRHPTDADLTGSAVAVDDRTVDFSTGSWADGEKREFHVCLAVDRTGRPAETDLQAARVDLAVVVAGSTEAELYSKPEPIRVHWTDDHALSSVLDPKVAHYLGHTDLHEAIKSGWEAHRAMKMDLAAAEWGRAVALAAKLNHVQVLDRMRRIVEVHGDPVDGVVRVRTSLRERDYFSVFFPSRDSSLSPDRSPEDPPPQQGPMSSCPGCSRTVRATDAFCEGCGHRFVESA
jgi:Ca-activated chloride channel family protein